MQGRSAPQRAWTAESRLALQRGGCPCVVRSTWLHVNVTTSSSQPRQQQREKIARQVIRVANEPGEASNEKELSHRSGSEVAQQLRIH